MPFYFGQEMNTMDRCPLISSPAITSNSLDLKAVRQRGALLKGSEYKDVLPR